MSDFGGKVALITGAASGLGRELALQLSAAGARIAGIDLQAAGLEQLTRDLAGRPVATALADVTDATGLAATVQNLETQLGPTDLLLACAGLGFPTPALEYDAAAIALLIQVNLIGVSNSIGAVLPGMLQRQRGHLAAISSLASYRGMPLMAGYCATKAGVNALLDSLRVELSPKGIVVTTICPGWVRTPMTAPVDIPMPDLMEPQDAVRIILAGLARQRSFIAFPGRLVRQLTLLRWLPLRWSDWLVRRELGKIKKK